MNSAVLDASALLGEPRADKVKAALDGSLMSVVNMAEVVSYYAAQRLQHMLSRLGGAWIPHNKRVSARQGAGSVWQKAQFLPAAPGAVPRRAVATGGAAELERYGATIDGLTM